MFTASKVPGTQSTYLLSKWRSCPITLKNSHSSPHNKKLTCCQAQPAQNRALGLSTPSLRFQNVNGYAWHISQIFGFQPCHILKGWSWAKDWPVLPPLFHPAVARGGAASPTHFLCRDIDLPRVCVWGGRSPPKEVNPQVFSEACKDYPAPEGEKVHD